MISNMLRLALKPARLLVVPALLFASPLYISPVMAADTPPPQTEEDTYRQLTLMMEVFERIRAQYVEEVDDRQLIEDAIRGMLAGLDPHSGYMGPEAFRENEVQMQGEYGGVGMEVYMSEGVLNVVSPMDDTPAMKAGMKPGDKIVRIDGQSLADFDVNAAVDLLRGPAGTDVEILVVREGVDRPFEVTLTRAVVQIKAVRSRVERDAIGYLRLTTFNNKKLASDLRKAILDIRSELGPKLQGYVLDLRNNPGGLLDQAIEVSDIFLERGEISSMRGRGKSDNARWSATRGDLTKGLPIIVLVNAGSASASEIVTGALQDHKRAIVLGMKTFGKGVVQSIIPLGPEEAMRLTTARYYTPSGSSIQARGIEPDIMIEPYVPDGAVYRPRREADLSGHIENEDTDISADDAHTVNRPRADYPEDAEIKDYQLDYALDLLLGAREIEQKEAKAS